MPDYQRVSWLMFPLNSIYIQYYIYIYIYICYSDWMLLEWHQLS